MPQHVFKNFDIDTISTASAAADITQPLNSSAIAGCACVLSAPAYLQGLPNLMVGSSAFYLVTYNGITGAGELLRNANYQRASWKVAAALPANLHTGASFTFTFTVKQWTVTPTGPTSVSAATYVPITTLVKATSAQLATCASGQIKVTGTANALTNAQPYSCVLVYRGNGQGTALGTLVGKYVITGGSLGVYHAVIAGLPAHTTTPAHYEIVVIGHYTYLGLPRSYFLATGFTK
jgi:microcystin-dependent protein